jgi:adenine/guanine phosphoribosyltransferase-like PRPP-binding protein
MSMQPREPLYPMQVSETVRLSALYLSIQRSIERLEHLDFDTIAFRGMSGAMVAPSVALALNKTLILCRRPEESSAAVQRFGHMVEGSADSRRYVILDSLVDTGDTIKRIMDSVEGFAPGAECAGVYLYADDILGRSLAEVKLLTTFKKVGTPATQPQTI